MNTQNTESNLERASRLLDNFYAAREKEARDHGYAGKVEDVMVVLGFKYPRQYSNVLEAIVQGWQPKTLDAVELVQIYGEIDAVIHGLMSVNRRLRELPRPSDWRDHVASALLQLLPGKYTGDWFPRNSIPAGWTALDRHHQLFRRVDSSFLGLRRNKLLFSVPGPIAEIVEDSFQ